MAELDIEGARVGAQAAALKAGATSITTNSQFNGGLLSAAQAPDVGAGTFTATPTFATVGTVTITDAASAATAATAFSTYIDSTVDNRATNAGNLASLQNTLQVLNSVATNEMAGIGQAQDTDIAKEMMSLTSANIMTEAATAMLSQAMQLPNSVLKLLQ